MGKPAKDFNAGAKSHLFCVSLSEGKSRRDFTAATEKMIETVRALAKENDAEARVRSGGASMNRLGVFYLSASERFARKVREMPGVASVARPSPQPRQEPHAEGRLISRKSS